MPSLRTSAGAVLEVIPVNVGFRKVEIKNGNLLVNGRRILIKGVNRHEHDARAGHVLSVEAMRADVDAVQRDLSAALAAESARLRELHTQRTHAFQYNSIY
jgi:hypothetical protein